MNEHKATKKIWTMMMAGVATLTFGISTAHADEVVIIFTPALATTTTTGVVITAVDGVSSTTSSTSDFFDDVTHVQTYLKHNAVALSQDISMGGGQTVTDLAVMARIDAADQEHFAALLRTQRATLVPLLAQRDEVTKEDAQRFARVLREAMSQDAQLAHYTRS